MCAVRHPDKLRELDSLQPATLLPRPRRNGTTAPNKGGNGKARAAAAIPVSAAPAPDERRLYPRLPLTLPLRLRRIAGQSAAADNGIRTKDLSSSGVRFEASHSLEVDTPVELEIELLTGPLGGRQLQMVTLARIVRVEPARRPGRWVFSASFEDITYSRQESAELAMA